MRKTLMSLAMLFALLTAAPVLAQDRSMTLDARSLLDACTRPSEAWISFCHGYIQAAFDVTALRPDTADRICAPDGTTRAAMADIFARAGTAHLAANPGLGALPAIEYAGAIITAAYNCED